MKKETHAAVGPGGQPPDNKGNLKMKWTITRPCGLTFQAGTRPRGRDSQIGKAGSH